MSIVFIHQCSFYLLNKKVVNERKDKADIVGY